MPNSAFPALRRIALPLAWAFLILSCSKVDNGGPDSGPEGIIKPVVPPTVDPVDEAVTVFDEDSLYHFDLAIADSLWEWLNKHPLDEKFITGDLKAMGKEWKNIGVRYKGDFGSLHSCVDSLGNLLCEKLSLKIRFDEYAKDQRFFGLKRINFNSMIYDGTKLHERLASQLFREMGIPAARTVHATLSVNGRNLGLFALVEQIDSRFAKSRFPRSSEGNLYKEVWPQSVQPGPYLAALETNEKAGDASAMVRFATDLRVLNADNHGTLLPKSVDVDYLLRYLAVDQTITNDDGVTTFQCFGEECAPHNFFWYQDDLSGKLWLLPWDLDGAFQPDPDYAGQPAWNDLAAGCKTFITLNDLSFQPAGCDPLFKSLARDYPDEYRKIVGEFLDGAFNIPRLNGLIDAWAAQIQPHLEQDPTRAQTMDDWKDEVRLLKESLETYKADARKRIR